MAPTWNRFIFSKTKSKQTKSLICKRSSKFKLLKDLVSFFEDKDKLKMSGEILLPSIFICFNKHVWEAFEFSLAPTEQRSGEFWTWDFAFVLNFYFGSDWQLHLCRLQLRGWCSQWAPLAKGGHHHHHLKIRKSLA